MADVRLMREYEEVNDDPRFSMVQLAPDDLSKAQCTIATTDDAPYECAAFEFIVVFPTAYPNDAPQVIPITKIYHPNLSHPQDVHTLLGGRWRADQSIVDVLIRIKHLLSHPDLNMPNIDEAIASEYSLDTQKYYANARASAKNFAVPRTVSGKLMERQVAASEHKIERILAEAASAAAPPLPGPPDVRKWYDSKPDTVEMTVVDATMMALGLFAAGCATALLASRGRVRL
mmetsp:Transcript_1418/g.3758  ORF Transcript_1418/g.3758 Transcript_1418/m.3758 type:complete len:231 (-) Transcript_1418:79-771(-)